MKVFTLLFISSAYVFGQCTPSNPGNPGTNVLFKLCPAGPAVGAVGYDKSDYDPLTNGGTGRVWLWGLFHSAYSENDNALIGYSYRTNSWMLSEVNGMFHTDQISPGGHTSGLFTIDPVHHFLYMFSDASGAEMPEIPYHFWRHDLVGMTSADKLNGSTANQKPLTGFTTPLGGQVFDSNHSTLVLFPNGNNHTSTYSPTTNLFTDLGSLSNQPNGAITSESTVYNPTDHKTYVFFGANSGSVCSLVFNTNIYAYDPGAGTWATVTQNNSGPAGRIYSAVAYSTIDQEFLIMGGDTCTNGPVNGGSNLTDIWTFKPSTGLWTQISSTAYNAVSMGGSTVSTGAIDPFERLSYDSDDNAFILVVPGNNTTDFAGGAWAGYSAGVWAFCLSTCSNFGVVSPTYTATPGYYNRQTSSSAVNNQSVAFDVAITVTGTTVYAGEIETTSGFVSGNFAPHPYAYSITNGGTVANLTPSGAVDPLAIDNDNMAGVGNDIAANLKLSVINGTLWASMMKVNNTGSWPAKVYTKTWNPGTPAWGAQSAVPIVGSNSYTGINALFGVGTTPTIAVLEWAKGAQTACSSVGNFAYAYLYTWGGSSWSALGSTLNRAGAATCTRSEAIAATSDGTNALVCHVETVMSSTAPSTVITTTPQVYCDSVNSGGTITNLGGSLNQLSTNWAEDVATVYAGSTQYVAWTERTTAGNLQLYLASWNGTSWVSVRSAASLNRTAVGSWATWPRLATDGTNVFLAHVEQPTLNAVKNLYVDELTAAGFLVPLGGPINMSLAGSAEHEDMTVVSGAPTLIWTEETVGNIRQAYIKTWTGSSWSMIGAAGTMDSGTGAPTSGVGSNGDLYHRTDAPYQSVYGPKVAGVWPSTFSYIVGQGCTTAYHVDKDCDGYGIGPTTISTDPNPLFGPDADDADATVNTTASVLSKYTTINAFLTHLGFPINRVYYIDAISGNDSNFASHACSYANPCKDWGAIASTVNDGAGGTVIYLPGISTGVNVGNPGANYYPHASSGSSPIVLMSYPGTMANFITANNPVSGGGGGSNASTYAIFDGFRLIAGTPGAGGGAGGYYMQHVTFENMEIAGWVEGVETSSGGQSVTVQNNLFHDISEHGLYPTTADQSGNGVYSPTLLNCAGWAWTNGPGYNPNFNLTLQNNVFLFVGSGGFDAAHINGETCTGTVTGNVFIGGGGTAITLQDGAQNVTISNNLIASNSAAGITINMYGCDSNNAGVQAGQIGVSCDSTYGGTGLGTFYFPSDEWNNTIVNNTIWTGLNPPVSYFCPVGSCGYPYYGINATDTSQGIPGLHSIKNTTIQNNLIVSFDGNQSGQYPQFQFGTNSYPDTNAITNNLFYNSYTGNSSAHVMTITANGNCSAQPWFCAGSSSGTYGSGSATPGTYSFSGFQTYNTGSNTGGLFGNPLFTDVQNSYYMTPNQFNFRLASGSPGIGAGIHSGAPTTDITGLTRSNPPSIGAYDLGGGPSGTMTLTCALCTGNLGKE